MQLKNTLMKEPMTDPISDWLTLKNFGRLNIINTSWNISWNAFEFRPLRHFIGVMTEVDWPHDQPHDQPHGQPHGWLHEQPPDKDQDHDFHHEQKVSFKLWLQGSFPSYNVLYKQKKDVPNVTISAEPHVDYEDECSLVYPVVAIL